MQTTSVKKLRYSDMRNTIYKYLCGTKEHPSAEMIYLDLRETNPNLSFGTVYRNLKQLEETGRIIRVSTVNTVKDTMQPVQNTFTLPARNVVELLTLWKRIWQPLLRLADCQTDQGYDVYTELVNRVPINNIIHRSNKHGELTGSSLFALKAVRLFEN